MTTIIPHSWTKSLGLKRLGNSFITATDQPTGHPYSEAIQDILSLGVSGVYCLEEVPCAAILYLTQTNTQTPEYLLNIYLALWNQGILDYLMIIEQDKIEIHSLSSSPAEWQKTAESGLTTCKQSLIVPFNLIAEASEIESIFSGIENGRFLSEYKEKFFSENKVDSILVNDLTGTRSLLLGKNHNTASQEEIAQVHDVLLQSMFLLYLEDKGIVGSDYLKTFGNGNKKLHELLRNSVDDFIKLLERLNVDFNGGTFSPKNHLWISQNHILANFMEGKVDMTTNYPRLLRLYKFEFIPVELLSEVYDRFLNIEGGKKQQGAFYTPRRLASLVVDQIWEKIQKHLDSGHLPNILDPACGSGIFLATLFQRIAMYLENNNSSDKRISWNHLRNIALHLHGTDINPTAIRITAFSISLAMLHRRTPLELKAKVKEEKGLLPDLLKSNFHSCDFFNLSEKNKYDIIIGNPPWGKPTSTEKNKGEIWCKENDFPPPPQRERAWPFIWKSIKHLPEDSHLVLLLPSTGFFLNNIKNNLLDLLRSYQFNTILDLSDLRHVLFKNAIAPACVLTATRKEQGSQHKFNYICPKADLNATRGKRIIISPDDRHIIWAHEFASFPKKTSQRLMWASTLERNLLSYLDNLPTLKKLPLTESGKAEKKFGKNRPKWTLGVGFQIKDSTVKKPLDIPELTNMPFIASNKLTAWVQTITEADKPFSRPNNPKKISRPKFTKGFYGPHIVFKRSTAIGNNFCLGASYSDTDYSYNDSAVGITVPNDDLGRKKGKFLTALLNSHFIGWFMCVNNGLAVERPRFGPSLLSTLPFPNPKDLPNSEEANRLQTEIAKQIDLLVEESQKKSRCSILPNEPFPSQRDIVHINSLIYKYLGLREEEISAIEDFLNYIRPAAQPAEGTMPKLWTPSNEKTWTSYCRNLETALNENIRKGIKTQASICGKSKDLVLVSIKRVKNDSLPKAHKQAKNLINLPENLHKKIESHLEGNIYIRRIVIIVTDQEIFVIKPRQMRFWLTGTAFSDAERILSHLFSSINRLH